LARILVIDDEDNLRKLVQANLAVRKHQVFLAPDGKKGLKVAQEEHPDLIFLDLMMPGMSGWEVLTALKADDKLKKIPVVIMTAAIQGSQEEKAFSRAQSAIW
jgi:CheY-like chemotaxis protein